MSEIFTIALLLAAIPLGIFCGYPVASWLSRKMSHFLLFLPTEKFDRPLPELSRASALALSGNVQEARDLYESFLEEFPENKEIYFRLIELTAGPLQKESYAREILKRAEENLEYESDHRLLREHFEKIQRRELIPLKHLAWCELPQTEHPQVKVPEVLKGQMLSSE